MLRLKELREERNISQKYLGDLFNVAQNTISNWENGTREPDAATLMKLADIFEVSVDYLLGQTDVREHTSKRINQTLAYLGDGYGVRRIDLENCVYKDLNNGYDIEISGLDDDAKPFNATIYVWKYDLLGRKKSAFKIVETTEKVHTLLELRDILWQLEKKYRNYREFEKVTDNIQAETIAAHHDGEEWTEEELESIEEFKEFVRIRREQKKNQ